MQLPSGAVWHSLFCWQSAFDSCSHARRHVCSCPTQLQSGLLVHVPESPMVLHVRRHSLRAASHMQSRSPMQSDALVCDAEHVVRHVEFTCMHCPLYLQSDEPVSRRHAVPHEPVVASHWQSGSLLHAVDSRA